jgi:hypothetical protein
MASDGPKLFDPNTDDPFDLARLRVSQDFLEITTTKKLITTVPIRRPGPQDFVRVHPSVEYRALYALLELKEDREIYPVDLRAVPELAGECFVATLFTAITRSGVLFLWPVRIPSSDGRINECHASMAVAAEHAMTKWVRVKANMSLRAYEVFVAQSPQSIPDPEWPDLTYAEICRIAFKDRHPVTRLDHPAAKRVRGG